MGIFRKFSKPDIEKMERDRDIGGLTKALVHKDDSVRLEAAAAFRRIGKPAVGLLIQNLRHEDNFDLGQAMLVEIGSVRALGAIGDTRAVEPLIQALKDEGVGVRSNAAFALGKIGDARAVEPLTQALRDEDKMIRRAAADALAEIRARVKPPPPQVEKCPSCGTEIQAEATFCPACGRRVK